MSNQNPILPFHEASDILSIIPPPFEWCIIPGKSVFHMVVGEEDKAIFAIAPFLMAKYPITFEQFQVFMDDPQGYKKAKWWRGLAVDVSNRKTPGTQPFTYTRNLPRVNVSWYDAVAFCRWLGVRAGCEIYLPTEWEWQWTAQGSDSRNYPWGKQYIQGYANVNEVASKIPGGVYHQKPTPVDSYPQGASPFGVLDMSGNVWEWCLNEYDDFRNISLVGSKGRALRGGAWNFNSENARIVGRGNMYYPDGRFDNTGFRVCAAHFFPG